MIERGSPSRRSTDDGQTWTTVHAARGFDVWIPLFAVGADVYAGVVCQETTSVDLWASNDHAASWSSTSWGAGWPQALAATAGGEAYAAALSAPLRRSSDHGRTWRDLARPRGESVLGLWIASTGEIYAVGLDGLILQSRDHGGSWVREPSCTSASLTGVWGSDRDDVYAVGSDGTILHRP